MKTEIETTKIPTGTFMLVWFSNPDGTPNHSDGKVENSVCTQFFSSQEDAELMAGVLSGNRIILTGWQNNVPSYNVYWYIVKSYGGSFDISKISVLSEEQRIKIIESEK